MKIRIAIAFVIAAACIAFIVMKSGRAGNTDKPPVQTAQPTTVKRTRTRDISFSDAETTRPPTRSMPRSTPRPPVDAAATPEPEPTPDTLASTIQEAREAVAHVGASHDAERVWTAAINNREIPAEIRAVLIAGLATFFSDGDTFTQQDLPLIQARLQLVEELNAEPLDNANATALAEVYRELTAIAERLSQPQQADSQQQQERTDE